MNAKKLRIGVLLAAMAAMAGSAWLLPRIPQPSTYHEFADRRMLFGIPNFDDVASNAPFLLVGIWGLAVVMNRKTAFRTSGERWPYAVLFAGVALTSIGSSYYHLHPDNARLVWDRLPMTLGFMGLLCAVLAERVGRRAVLALPALVALGMMSVAYWNFTEANGRGDLRPYLLVQFGSLAVVLLVLFLFDATYTGQKWLVAALALYGVAKIAEAFDASIYRALGVVSGHTLKHVAAAAGALCMAAMLKRRTDTIRSRTKHADFPLVPAGLESRIGCTPTI